MASIGTIDISPFMASEGATVGDAPTQAQVEVAAQINDAFRDDGFLFIDGIGISDEQLEQYYEMSATLFSLPDDYKKSSLKQIDRKTNAGYAGSGIESLNSKRKPDLKEVSYGFSTQLVIFVHLGKLLWSASAALQLVLTDFFAFVLASAA